MMLGVRLGDRAVPLLWRVEAGAVTLGFPAQRALLDRVPAWL